MHWTKAEDDHLKKFMIRVAKRNIKSPQKKKIISNYRKLKGFTRSFKAIQHRVNHIAKLFIEEESQCDIELTTRMHRIFANKFDSTLRRHVESLIDNSTKTYSSTEPEARTPPTTFKGITESIMSQEPAMEEVSSDKQDAVDIKSTQSNTGTFNSDDFIRSESCEHGKSPPISMNGLNILFDETPMTSSNICFPDQGTIASADNSSEAGLDTNPHDFGTSTPTLQNDVDLNDENPVETTLTSKTIESNGVLNDNEAEFLDDSFSYSGIDPDNSRERPEETSILLSGFEKRHDSDSYNTTKIFNENADLSQSADSAAMNTQKSAAEYEDRNDDVMVQNSSKQNADRISLDNTVLSCRDFLRNFSVFVRDVSKKEKDKAKNRLTLSYLNAVDETGQQEKLHVNLVVDVLDKCIMLLKKTTKNGDGIPVLIFLQSLLSVVRSYSALTNFESAIDMEKEKFMENNWKIPYVDVDFVLNVALCLLKPSKNHHADGFTGFKHNIGKNTELDAIRLPLKRLFSILMNVVQLQSVEIFRQQIEKINANEEKIEDFSTVVKATDVRNGLQTAFLLVTKNAEHSLKHSESIDVKKFFRVIYNMNTSIHCSQDLFPIIESDQNDIFEARETFQGFRLPIELARIAVDYILYALLA